PIEEDGISALATWPAGRAVDAQAIQGAVALPGLHLSREEFGRRAAPVLAWSKAQNPECRQYVYIIDEAETKQAFKRNLLFVEDYFYKYLERDRSKHRPVQTADGAPRLLPESPSSPSGTK